MKKLALLLLASVLLLSCQEEPKPDAETVVAKFKENAAKINSLELKVRRIDTFPSEGVVWNNTGSSIIEKDDVDEIYGYSFYAVRDDLERQYIYDQSFAFHILNKEKVFAVEPGSPNFMGSPGGQMIPPNILHLDSIYKSISLVTTDSTYILNYTFEDDTNYDITQIKKRVVLNKEDFFPIKYERTSYMLGERSATYFTVLDYKTNEQVTSSVKEKKEILEEYSLYEQDEILNPLLEKKAPLLELPDVLDDKKMIKINYTKLTLLDFWEVWCGACIASFPDVEALKNKYQDQLQVVGIVSRKTEKAQYLIDKKGVSFQNLKAELDLVDSFGVYSWPRYFLIDADGIVQKEYHGFSEEIEADIKELIKN